MADYTKEEQIAAYGITDEAMRAHFVSRITQQGSSTETYSVRRANKTNCEFPSDEALLKFCDDGDLLGPPQHFGGVVDEMEDFVIVTVYTE